jgi:post-segregation antitoxin (ccd killing protein)
MKKTVTIYLDFDLYQKLQEFKINNHINISSFIASVIKEKLEKEKPLAK